MARVPVTLGPHYLWYDGVMSGGEAEAKKGCVKGVKYLEELGWAATHQVIDQG